MKFVPKFNPENHNISNTNVLLEFMKLFVGLIVGVLLLYLSLGTLSVLVVDLFPNSIQKYTDRMYSFIPESSSKFKEDTQHSTQLLSEICRVNHIDSSRYSISIIESKEANAFTMGGGRIHLLEGLFQSIHSDDEMTFILAHELGHYIHHDHLKRFSFFALPAIVTTTIFGANSVITNVLNDIMMLFSLSYSRKQELAADQFAIQTLTLLNIPASSGVSALKAIQKDEFITDFFSTHPLTESRISAMKN